uniref:Uncharacterized protein n=1 Tax=Oryza rufipogon TaxID=4529 RepID=A0A0E0NR14_ORYRU
MGISESDELRAFEATGIYRLAESGAAFLDPVRILNASYRRFRLVPSAYYSRSFGTSRQGGEAETERTGEASPERKKRKRKRQRQPKPRELNEVERMAEARHQGARPLLSSAHKSLLKAKDLLEFLPRMIKEDVRMLDVESNLEKNLVELGSSWRAPLCEMTLCFQKSSGEDSEEDNYNQGYNLIVVDPPWENGCVRQKVATKRPYEVQNSSFWKKGGLCHSHWRSASAECACRAAEWRSSSISSMPLRVATLVRNGTRRWTQGTKSPYPSSCRGRCTRRRPRRPARRDRPCRRGDDAVNPNDASAPARAFGICRQGQFRPLTDVSKNPYYEPIIPAPAPNHCNCRAQRLASEMPGLRPESPAIPSPELRRVRTSFTGASSWVATTAMCKVVRSANAPVEPKAKVEDVEKQRRRGKGGCNGTVSSARCRSPPPSPVSPELGKTRCSWITVNSEPLYVAFHDEEWGVPVHDDQKLFELLTLSQALAEITWPIILNKRDEFREMFDGFNYASVSEFTDKKINLLSKSNGNMLLSEQKIRAVVTNAKQMHKVIQDFGSFSNYCWSFVKHKPVKSNFRYARQVPIKTPKSEAISKGLMRRGFQCVGPTTIYSFMQVSGIVNDHLSCCFRFQDCRDIKRNLRAEPGLIERRLNSPPSSEDSETSREA